MMQANRPARLGITRILGVILLLVTSCQRGQPDLGQVEGKVYYRGTPLNGGTIVFTPDPERGGHGPLASAEIQTDGSYKLRTSDQDGAPPGWHRVTVADADGASLPIRYMDPEQSGQHFEVRLGQPNTIDIHLD